MPFRTMLIGGAAIVFGSSAAVGAYLLAQPTGEDPHVKTVAVVVAAKDTPRGVTLTAEMLVMQPWPQDYLPKDALLSLEEAEGRAVGIPLVKDEPITDAKLAARGAGRGMAAMIPRGMRAVTLQTPNVSTAMAGFILPGNRVDVLLSIAPSGGASSAGGSSIALLQNVEVLAVDQRIDATNEDIVDSGAMQSVTLLVTPTEAARLDLGQNRGILRLALRNPEDSEISEIQPAMLSALELDQDVIAAADTPPPEPAAGEAERLDVESTATGSLSPPASVLLPIRTLRGTSNNVLYIRQPAERQQALVNNEVPDEQPSSL